jgi:hypothetical protein
MAAAPSRSRDGRKRTIQGGSDYAMGGARDALWRAKESSGAACRRIDECQVIGPVVVTRSKEAAASAGMCSA